MKIVFIHGMNKQQYTATSLRQHWLHLFKTGLRKNPQQQARFTYLKRHIRIPFYGDLLSRHHFHNVLNASSLMPQQWPHFPFLHPAQLQPAPLPDQCTYQICDVPQLNLDDALNFNQKLKFITALSKDIALRDFAVLINYFPSLHASFLHKFLLEAYLYLANPHFMQEVHCRIHDQLYSSRPQILVAHSLGSVIAYNYLIQHPELNIKRFITLGSPLAFKVIQAHLPQPIVRPAAISGDWINFYCSDDFLTAFPLSEPPFQFQPAVINQEIHTSIYHPHDIDGYIQHPDIIKALLELL
ncbi:alpha/beta hydrolase [Acinetobacter lwoffii]|uniref:alpha/beta fold hydrolase n=1 Tax=Acinetobacter lwoffii TaxID=28090 RepID=UPI00300807ED